MWRLRLFGLLAVQSGIAAGLAWFVAHRFLGHPAPVFAPTVAVGIVAASMGSRLRRTIELLVGVVLGLAVGDTLMPLFGIGPWQTGAVVVLAILVAILLKGGGSLLTQAGGTAVLIATLEPPVRDLSIPRFVDAAVGGLLGLVVGLLLVPIHPQRTISRLAAPVLDEAISALHGLGRALRQRDLVGAENCLRRLRDLDPGLQALSEGVDAAHEVVRLAPLRWRNRPGLAVYANAVRHIERALHSCRSLSRRMTTALKDDEPVPPELPDAIDLLTNSVQSLRLAIRGGRDPHEARDEVLQAVKLACQAQGDLSPRDADPRKTVRIGYSGVIAVGQFRTAAHDLLIAGGLSAEDAADRLKQAAPLPDQVPDLLG